MHVTWESPEDPDVDLVFECEVSIRDFNREKDVVFLTNPTPVWEVDDASGDVLEYPLVLNPRTARERDHQPHWAHSLQGATRSIGQPTTPLGTRSHQATWESDLIEPIRTKT